MTSGLRFGARAATCRTKEGLLIALMLIILGLLLSTPALAAADSDMTKEYLACMDKAKGVTAEMIDCISAETARQDARLNANYKKLMLKLSAKRKKTLLEAQRTWIKFRDLNCELYYDPDGGTAARLAGSDCFLQATADRAKELKNLTNDE
jgi:uncharacterized protein YecT (DUF1311 family)